MTQGGYRRGKESKKALVKEREEMTIKEKISRRQKMATGV